jgi:glycosyltransferase involved in cell wall biosynthesis
VEAMSLGIPAVGTRVSGIEDVIEDGVTGWLVEPANPRALADRLACATASAAARTRVGEAGRTAVETRFSAEAVAAAHDRLYQALLNGHGPLTIDD